MRITEAIREALLGNDGDILLRVLRQCHYLYEQRGCIFRNVDLADEQCGATVSRACELGLLRETHCRLEFTPAGYELANVAKEYCNWVEAGRRLPIGVSAEFVRGKRVLDVGCGFGRWTMAFARYAERACGVEPQDGYRTCAMILAEKERVVAPDIRAGTAERLPFGGIQFDIVFCRLVLNYVRSVNDTLSEFARVLVPGGIVVLSYANLTNLLMQILSGIRRGNSRKLMWGSYALVNTLSLILTNRQLCFRSKGLMHDVHSPTYPPVSWVCRALTQRGFVISERHSELNRGGYLVAVLRERRYVG